MTPEQARRVAYLRALSLAGGDADRVLEEPDGFRILDRPRRRRSQRPDPGGATAIRAAMKRVRDQQQPEPEPVAPTVDPLQEMLDKLDREQLTDDAPRFP